MPWAVRAGDGLRVERRTAFADIAVDDGRARRVERDAPSHVDVRRAVTQTRSKMMSLGTVASVNLVRVDPSPTRIVRLVPTVESTVIRVRRNGATDWHLVASKRVHPRRLMIRSMARAESGEMRTPSTATCTPHGHVFARSRPASGTPYLVTANAAQASMMI
jgi:hypothetical protein